MPVNNNLFYGFTTSLCPLCLQTIPAKIIIRDKAVYLLKRCTKHGVMENLLEEDADFFLEHTKYLKPGTASKTQTEIQKGCPFDCGLCPDHEQHTCIGMIEITNKCNLKCPVCYANAGSGKFLSLNKIEKMMDFLVAAEGGSADILQITGGEPTMHPKIIEILQLARTKAIKYILLNTNGLRIATDPTFVKELSFFRNRFEVYLQFDGFEERTYRHLRGKNIYPEKKKAIENLVSSKIPTTFVSTIENGINDYELGRIFTYALETPCIRGINFQPVTFFGRLPGKYNPDNRITLTGIIKRLINQTNGMLQKGDFIPLPCHPERIAFSYLYRENGGFIPVTRSFNTQKYLPIIKNTFTFRPTDLPQMVLSAAKFQCDCFDLIKNLQKLIPLTYHLKSNEEKKKYIDENIFRVSITSFLDRYNFDMKSMKKECMHIITPDFKRIPFSAYNLFHRHKYVQ